MNQVKFLLVTALMTQATFSTCSSGCLKCGDESRCLVCDLSNSYINQQGTCVKQSAENCHLLSNDGTCLRCDRGFYIDNSTNKCVELPKDQKILNCEFQKSLNSCLLCKKNYYLTIEGKCEKVEIYVPGCKISGKTHCFVCDDDKVLHPSGERCIRNPNTAKCLAYSFLECHECEEGYIHSEQLFFDPKDEKANLNIQRAIQDLTRDEIAIQEFQQTPCQKAAVQNCEKYISFSQCGKCKEFHYLDEKKQCQRNPLPEIPNCQIYTNYNVCTKCNQGFLLSNPESCLPIKPIDNCILYDSTTAINLCQECEEGFYVQGNKCVARQNIVNNCAVYSKIADKCLQCSETFLVSDDNLLCLKQIENCAQYLQSNVLTTSLTCKTCNQRHYMEANQCKLGTLSNCRIYSNKDICATCDNKFYWGLNEQQVMACVQQPNIDFCNIYSTTTKSYCNQCDNTHVQLLPQNGCEKITNLITHCTVYQDQLTCTQCEDGYYLFSNTFCESIPEIENCKRKIGNNVNCVLCKDNYVLRNGVCQDPLNFQVEHCQNYLKTTNSERTTCSTCDQFSFYYNGGQDFGHCINDTEKQRFYTNSTIDKCLYYKIDNLNGNLTCKRCDSGYYPNDNLTGCVQNCPNQLFKQVYKGVKGEKIDLSYCINANLSGCEIVAPLLQATTGVQAGTLTCTKCKTGYIKILSATANNYVSLYKDDVDLKHTVGIERLGFECLQQNQQVYTSTNTTTPPLNCNLYKVNGVSGKLDCKVCQHGYTGLVESSDPQNLNCSSKIQDCNIDVLYGGLFTFNYSKANDTFRHLTCHECMTEGRIPFLFIKKNFTLEKFGIEFGLENLEQSVSKTGQTLQCIEPSARHFRIPDEKYQAIFPQNCAVGLFYTDAVIDYRNFAQEQQADDGPIDCLHCKPGYRPLFRLNRIVKCEKIDNCTSDIRRNKWFNSCSSCNYGYAWKVIFGNNNFPQIHYNRCTWSKGDLNCIAYSEDTNVKRQCVFCRNGHFLNGDGICERFRAPLCKLDQTFFTPTLYNSNNSNHNYFYYEYTKLNGCYSCNTSYYPMSLSSGSYDTCFESPYIMRDEFIEKTTFVPQCQYYRAQIVSYQNAQWQHLCNQCIPGYILDTQQSACVPLSAFPRCSIADLQNKVCHKCQDGFVKVSGFCEKPIIKYCDQYSFNEDYQKCELCMSKYMLVDNHCIFGDVRNCDRYNDEKCISCLVGFNLLNIETTQYCLPKIESFNCANEVIDSVTRNWSCNTCKTDYLLTLDIAKRPLTHCAPIVLIDNCKTYHNNIEITESQYKCTECLPEYFLKDNKCLVRKNYNNGCLKYAIKQDFCVQCHPQHYLTNQKECVQYPTGIYKCMKYKNEKTCLKCDEGYFLSNSRCYIIPKELEIDHCRFYENYNVCQECDRDYYLAENQCIEAHAKNCAKFKSIKECESCIPQHGFFKDQNTGVLSCIYVSTQNCQKTELQYPFHCVKCNTLYYLNDGKCFDNETFIPDCLDYDSANTCAKCYQGFILSSNKKQCIKENLFGYAPHQNCRNNLFTTFPKCSVCNAGYFLQNGQCNECQKFDYNSGCMHCQVDKEFGEKCLICRTGYFMNTNGVCQENGSVPDVIQNQPTNQTTNTANQQQTNQQEPTTKTPASPAI